ncbi:molybdate ABC transporter substrate-binding protein [Saccharomonospora sp.]|uniref:molybdate ABC transporter substrate-binding protein n=1 Tax=Saccharomonospora sp. TaxID=33913 RepID=UPI002617869A|nr:molybdate ABC transporter substrate-binding protein [Saccharomonospora sp.]
MSRRVRGVTAVLSSVVTAALVMTSMTACGAASGDRVLTVFAAASLTDVLPELERRFEKTHEDVDVRLHFAGSAQLAQQIAEGAPADVFAAADAETMARLDRDDLLDGPATPFATNTLTIAVPEGNPAGVTGLADLADPALTVVVCAPSVPCGAATRHVERLAGVTLRPASEEADVRSVLTKVETGEADAGLVYVTDVAAASRGVEQVRFPEAAEAVNTYPVGIPVDAAHKDLARQFRDLLLSDEGRRLLKEAGFGASS